QRADRVLRPHLAGLVEDDQIEARAARIEELRDRERAHQKARLDALDDAAGLGEEFSDGHVPAPAMHLAEEDADFGVRRGAAADLRPRAVQSLREASAIENDELPVELAKARDLLFVHV